MVSGHKVGRFAAFALLCTAACTSSSGAAPIHNASPTTTAPAFAPFNVNISGDAAADVVDGLRTTLAAYLDRAVVTPLHTGTPGDVAALFSSDLAPAVSGPDHSTLVDDGIAGVVRIQSPTATAVVTAAGSGIAALHLDMTVVALVGTTPVTIHRTGDLSLVHDGDGWHIDSYDLHVTRDSTP